MAFKLPPLPYGKDALEPHISKETVEFHYGKHHAAYVNNLNSELPLRAFDGQFVKGRGPQCGASVRGASVSGATARSKSVRPAAGMLLSCGFLLLQSS